MDSSLDNSLNKRRKSFLKLSFEKLDVEKVQLEKELKEVDKEIENMMKGGSGNSIKTDKSNKSDGNSISLQRNRRETIIKNLEERRDSIRRKIEINTEKINSKRKRDFSKNKSRNNFSQFSHTSHLDTKVAVINQTKNRMKKVVQNSNKAFKEVLKSYRKNYKKFLSKSAPIRSATLFKLINKIYTEYDKKINAQSDKDPIPLKNFIMIFLKQQSSLKKGLEKKYKSVKIYL